MPGRVFPLFSGIENNLSQAFITEGLSWIRFTGDHCCLSCSNAYSFFKEIESGGKKQYRKQQQHANTDPHINI